MTRDDREIVSAFHAALVEQVGADRFDVWFAKTTRFDIEAGQVVVFSASKFTSEWLRKHFYQEIEQVAARVGGSECRVSWRVDAALRRKSQASEQTPAAAEVVGASGEATGSASSGDSPSNGKSREGAQAILKDAAGSVSREASKPLAGAQGRGRAAGGSRRRFASFESFVVGPSNRVAHTSAQMVAAAPGSISPLVIHGPTGTGKTHLIESIWSSLRQRGRRVVYLSAEQFTSHFLAALHGGGLPNFRHKYRDVDLLVIDDLQFFVGKKATIGELQHTIDHLLREGKQLVLAADRPPNQLQELGADLAARLAGGLVVGMQSADEATRLSIARRMANERCLPLEEEILELVARKTNGDVRQISGALHRIWLAGEVLGHAPSVEEAGEALQDLIQEHRAPVRLTDVESAVCELFGVDGRDLRSSRKSRNVTRPRMLAMWLARKHTPAALAEIGEYFGGRRHSTVVSAKNKVDDWLAEDLQVETAKQCCSLQEAVRQLEGRIRVG